MLGTEPAATLAGACPVGNQKNKQNRTPDLPRGRRSDPPRQYAAPRMITIDRNPSAATRARKIEAGAASKQVQLGSNSNTLPWISVGRQPHEQAE